LVPRQVELGCDGDVEAGRIESCEELVIHKGVRVEPCVIPKEHSDLVIVLLSFAEAGSFNSQKETTESTETATETHGIIRGAPWPFP
jgi:hypothetical protein